MLAPGAATAVARKNVPAFALNVNAPLAATLRPADGLQLAGRGSAEDRDRRAPPRAALRHPAGERSRLLPALLAARLTAPGAIAAGEATVARDVDGADARVVRRPEAIHAPDDTRPKTPLIVSSAL